MSREMYCKENGIQVDHESVRLSNRVLPNRCRLSETRQLSKRYSGHYCVKAIVSFIQTKFFNVIISGKVDLKLIPIGVVAVATHYLLTVSLSLWVRMIEPT